MYQLKIDPLFLITRYTHFFKITNYTDSHIVLINKFAMAYVQVGFRPKQKYFSTQIKEPAEKVFGLSIPSNREYRFHIGQLNNFIEFLGRAGYPKDTCQIVDADRPIPELFHSKIKPGWALRDRQPEVIEFLNAELPNDYNSRLVTMPTGSGKTLLGLWNICERKLRTAIIVLPSYLDKWHYDIQHTTTSTSKDIVLVQGSDYIRGLIHLAQNGQYNKDFLLISMKTWTNFIDSYIKDPEFCVKEEYGCSPDELLNLLGIGTILFDEIHQHLHAVYKTMCFINVDKVIGLSATFLSNDPFVDMIQKTMFPREIRFNEVKMKKYIRAYGISYAISPESLKHIRTSDRGSTTYSQTAFEKSILKRKDITKSYLELIEEVVNNGFMDQYKIGHKCIIYCRTIVMCKVLVDYLQVKFPHLSVLKYTEEDPYENLLKPAIRVTTYQSAGTAHDIPGLMTNITLDNMNSHVANIQCLGRLREPKEGTARYFAVYSSSIKKHVDYQHQRFNLLREKVETFKEFRSRIVL